MSSAEQKNQTIIFKNKPAILAGYSIVGPYEGEGRFGTCFDYVMKHDRFNEISYERAERKMLEHAIFGAMDKAHINNPDLDAILAGDLLNQIITSSFAARCLDACYLGVFGACSAMSLSLILGATLIDGGYMNTVACATASHFSTAERQFRFPLELGNQRIPTSQWTVTAAACSILGKNEKKSENSEKKGKEKDELNKIPYLTCATIGKVVDYGISDVNNMGAAMAPSAASTLLAHFRGTKTKPSDYDIIATGDLGKLGARILRTLLENEGIELGAEFFDCGEEIFNLSKLKGTMGGSGPGCSAAVLNSYILSQLQKGEAKRVLFVATGALLSPTSSQQGHSIPSITHAVEIRVD